MFRFLKQSTGRTVPETPLSNFIRNASSGDKKRVYSEVLRKATESQVRVLEEAEREHRASMAGEDGCKPE
jgi:hypothetical protein